ncbi:carboxypeptidase-like regulatory domain-containing protein [candidate division KSB1 bacterium]
MNRPQKSENGIAGSSKINRIIFLIFCFIIIPVSLYAQGKITGRVTDSRDDKPLQFANVVLKGTILGSATDENGNYEIANIPAGVYIVQASFMGYEPAEVKSVSVSARSTVTVDLELKETAQSLSEIVVTPGYYSIIKSAPGSKVSFTKENIETTALWGGDIYRAVTRLPGIIGNDYSSKFTVRGGETDEVLVLFDGLELYDPFHVKDFGGVLSIIPTDAIGGIDLLTGGYPAEYGRRKSGVFNIKSDVEPVDELKSTIGLSFMNGSYLARGPFAGDRGNWMFSMRRGFIDLALKLTGDDDDLLPRYYDIMGKVDYELNFDHKLSLHFLRAGDKLHFVDDDSLGSFSNSGYTNTYGWANLKSYFGDDIYVQTVLSTGLITHERSGTIYDMNFLAFDLGVNDNRDFKFTGFKQDWNYGMFRRLLIKAGVEYKKLWADYDYYSKVGKLFQEGGDVRDPYYVDTLDVKLEPDGEELGAYFSTRIKLMKSLYIETGLRYDKQSYIGVDKTSPRVNASYALGSNTVIKAGWGKFYQSQGIHELYVQDNDLEFDSPEESEHRIIGVEHKFDNGIELRLDAYRKNLKDYYMRYINVYNTIDVFEEASGDRMQYRPNGGKAEGIEFFLKRDTGGEITWWLSYSYSSAKDLFLTDEFFKSFDQTHSVDFNLNYRPNDKWRFNVAWIYHTGWPYTGVESLDYVEEYILGLQEFRYSRPEINLGKYNQTRFPDYHRLDVRVTRNFKYEHSRLMIYLELINAYDRENIRSREYAVYFPDNSVPPVVQDIDNHWLRFIPSIGIIWER